MAATVPTCKGGTLATGATHELADLDPLGRGLERAALPVEEARARADAFARAEPPGEPRQGDGPGHRPTRPRAAEPDGGAPSAGAHAPQEGRGRPLRARAGRRPRAGVGRWCLRSADPGGAARVPGEAAPPAQRARERAHRRRGGEGLSAPRAARTARAAARA